MGENCVNKLFVGGACVLIVVVLWPSGLQACTYVEEDGIGYTPSTTTSCDGRYTQLCEYCTGNGTGEYGKCCFYGGLGPNPDPSCTPGRWGCGSKSSSACYDKPKQAGEECTVQIKTIVDAIPPNYCVERDGEDCFSCFPDLSSSSIGKITEGTCCFTDVKLFGDTSVGLKWKCVPANIPAPCTEHSPKAGESCVDTCPLLTPMPKDGCRNKGDKCQSCDDGKIINGKCCVKPEGGGVPARMICFDENTYIYDTELLQC